MMNVVFKKNDFILCDVPVPRGYPQSQTHVGVVKYKGSFYLITSPYPVIKRKKLITILLAIIKKISFGVINKLYTAENFENPCIYKGYTSGDEVVPIKFLPCYSNPIEQAPSNKYGLGAYCSDPDISLYEDEVRILNRVCYRKGRTGFAENDYEIEIRMLTGSFDSEKELIVNNTKILSKEYCVSPCLVYYKKENYLFMLHSNAYNDGLPCEKLVYRKYDANMDRYSNDREIKLDKGEFEPWHMSVFEYNNHLFAILACVKSGFKNRCWQMLGEFSEDLSSLTVFQKPLTDLKSYRGSAMVDKNGLFILYNSTDKEVFSGTKSVDGRDVIVASINFEVLLSSLK